MKHDLWLDCFSHIMKDCMDRYGKTKSSKSMKINNSMNRLHDRHVASTRIYIGI